MATSNDRTLPFDDSNPHIKKYLKQLSNPILQRLFLFAKLPSAFFMGIKVRSVTPSEAKVTVPYSWRSQNPFKSTYFAAQAAAAEMITMVRDNFGLRACANRGCGPDQAEYKD